MTWQWSTRRSTGAECYDGFLGICFVFRGLSLRVFWSVRVGLVWGFLFLLCSSAENEWEGNWIYDEGWRSYSLSKWSDEQAECYKGMTWKDRFSLINDERQKQWRDRLYEQSVGWRRWSSYICIYALRPTCAPVGAALCVEQIPYKKFKGKGMSASSSFIRFYVENLGNHKSKCVTTVFCSYFSQPQSSLLSHRSWNNGFFIV